MPLIVDVLLLVCGAIATFAAFGGDTLQQGNEPFLKRLTTRGWISLSFLGIALLLGLVDQVQASSESKALDDQFLSASNQRDHFKGQLDATNKTLVTAREQANGLKQQLEDANTLLQDSKSQLSSARSEITQLNDQLDQAQKSIDRIPKEVDSGVASLQRKTEYTVLSGGSGKAILVRGGDIIEFDLYDNRHSKARPLNLELRAGKFNRKLESNVGRFRVFGMADRTEELRVVNFDGVEDVNIKLTILRAKDPAPEGRSKK